MEIILTELLIQVFGNSALWKIESIYTFEGWQITNNANDPKHVGKIIVSVPFTTIRFLYIALGGAVIFW